jgi:uncharacterized protein with beta-barrel porin domain
VVGFALAGGGTGWSLASSLGSGKSDAFQPGVYGATRWGRRFGVKVDHEFRIGWHRHRAFAFAGSSAN